MARVAYVLYTPSSVSGCCRCDDASELLFCENETNNARLFGTPNVTEYVKDGINDYVVHGVTGAVNPAGKGTKAAALQKLVVAPGESERMRLRLTSASAPAGVSTVDPLGAGFDSVLNARRSEADDFYATVIDPSLDADATNVMRQALAGMLWSKQYYEYDVHTWLREHGVNPWSQSGQEAGLRNTSWFHLDAGDVISMPDKWEYPWFAAWDLALQTLPLAIVDVDFAKGQMELLLKDRYLHPNGQIPAYEWNFSDVNPPFHAWSALLLYEREREIRGEGDAVFLERVFGRLLTNFTWWVNRKDPDGRNLFQGGFLGLDNIGVFDRSAPLPGGGSLEQADGTAWMALYCQAMLQMALELSSHDPAYADMATKFGMHLVWIGAAMNPPDGEALWSEEDGFYYDVIRLPDGSTKQLQVRSLVGLLPMCAATVIDEKSLERVPDLLVKWDAFISKYQEAIPALAQRAGPGVGGKRLASLVGVDRLRRILAIMLDESEFLGPFGIRSISRYHADHPYVFDIAGQQFRVDYEPAESSTGMFGGNSNWRGPVWFPDEHGDSARAATAARVLRRHPEGGVPDRLGQRVEPARGRRRDRSPTCLDLHARRGRPASRVRRDRAVPVRPALARPAGVPRVLPRRQRGWPRCQPPDRLDGPRGDTARADGGSRRDTEAPGQDGPIAVRLPARPTIYEINTAVWLGDLTRELNQAVDLSTVPAQEWDRLAALRVDAVWLMGVWQRSPAGLAIARGNSQLMASFSQTLPDLEPDDVIGSPYCVRDYTVDPRFGGPAALATARGELAARGIGLILDYVPNHVAPDHPWTAEHADYFIQGTTADLEANPASFLETPAGVLANGKDPYFAPWPDVVQLNAFSPGLRTAATETLTSIGSQCDGVRCDMAMLMTNEVFARTWGERAGDPPAGDYWPTIIAAVRATHPTLVFIAEAYWDMEWTLQQQGFDFCYDKRLYDRLVSGPADSVRGHLQAATDYQEGLLRFIENHDEPRAADTFAPEQQRAVAVVMSTLEGARMYHAGQLEGLHTHIPVFLARGPQQSPDLELRAFYEKLLGAVAESHLRDGEWQLCECSGWPDNQTAAHVLAWCWRANDDRYLVVVNLAAEDGQAQVHLPWGDLAGRRWNLRPLLDGDAFEREGDEMRDQGLYVGMRPWEYYFFALTA